MTRQYKRLAAIVCGLSTIFVGAGCQSQQSSSVPPSAQALTTPEQRQSDIDSNDHIPAAQKAAMKAQMAQEAQVKAEPTPAASH